MHFLGCIIHQKFVVVVFDSIVIKMNAALVNSYGRPLWSHINTAKQVLIGCYKAINAFPVMQLHADIRFYIPFVSH